MAEASGSKAPGRRPAAHEGEPRRPGPVGKLLLVTVRRFCRTPGVALVLMTQGSLFSTKKLSTYFDQQIEGLGAAAMSMTLNALANEAEAILSLRKKFEVSRIELQLDDIDKPTVDEDERRRPRVTILVNTRGDHSTPALCEMRPSQGTGTPPSGEVVPFRYNRPTSIKFEYVSETREVDAEAVKLWHDQRLSDLKQWVAWVNDDIDVFYSRVAQEANSLVPKRKAEHVALQRLRDDLST